MVHCSIDDVEEGQDRRDGQWELDTSTMIGFFSVDTAARVVASQKLCGPLRDDLNLWRVCLYHFISVVIGTTPSQEYGIPMYV
jgi:hypothetical protein